MTLNYARLISTKAAHCETFKLFSEVKYLLRRLGLNYTRMVPLRTKGPKRSAASRSGHLLVLRIDHLINQYMIHYKRVDKRMMMEVLKPLM